MARYDSEGIEIPPTPWYVTTTDAFMSGWGMARGKTNKLIFPCDSLDEAQTVERNAKNRTDQKYVNITGSWPRYSGSRYYIQVKTKEDYTNWYKEGYFNGT